jgi:hypothetical protein
MVDKYTPPFGTYTGAQVCAALGQAEIIANLQSLVTLMGGGTIDSTNGVCTGELGTAQHPDFNKISPYMRSAICRELAEIAKVVDAMPTS